MIELYAHAYYQIAERLADLERTAQTGNPEHQLSREACDAFIEQTLDPIQGHATMAGLGVSLRAIGELHAALTRVTALTVHEFRQHINTLRSVIRYELESIEVYQVDKGRQQFLDAHSLSEVAGAFRSIRFDLSEAARCFAYERNTACVFHLMRIMEAGLRTVGSHVGVSVARPDWDTVLVQSEARVKNGTAPNKKFLIEAIAQLRAVKRAWRNDVMHVGSEHTDEHAREIYSAVKAFMRHLSTELRETATAPGIAPPPVKI